MVWLRALAAPFLVHIFIITGGASGPCIWWFLEILKTQMHKQVLSHLANALTSDKKIKDRLDTINFCFELSRKFELIV